MGHGEPQPSNGPISGDIPTPLTPARPRWDFARPGATESGGERLLLTVCVHGNEPCGMLAVNELLQEGFFDFAADAAAWPDACASLTVLLGNPAGVEAGQRFLDSNLNRLLTAEDVARAESGSGASAEHGRVAELAAAIAAATQHVDVHSSSAASLPFCFHLPGAATAAFAASFPVAFAVEDASLQGTTIDWAHRSGVERSILVECGQHNARTSVDTAKSVIRRLVTGRAEPGARPPTALRTVGGVHVRPGFRYRREVEAFQLARQGELIAEDDEQGEIRCPHPQARLVMPTRLPVAGEEAWLWGVGA